MKSDRSGGSWYPVLFTLSGEFDIVVYSAKKIMSREERDGSSISQGPTIYGEGTMRIKTEDIKKEIMSEDGKLL